MSERDRGDGSVFFKEGIEMIGVIESKPVSNVRDAPVAMFKQCLSLIEQSICDVAGSGLSGKVFYGRI